MIKANWQLVLVKAYSNYLAIRYLTSLRAKRLLAPPLSGPIKIALILLLAQLLSSCDSATQVSVPVFSKEPRLHVYDSEVSLATVIAFESDQAVSATYRISDGQRSWQAYTSVGKQVKDSDYRKIHRDILLKFKPDTLHRIYVRITNAAGQATEYAKPLLFRTPALPADFPQIDIESAASGGRQNDIALISVLNSQTDSSQRETHQNPDSQQITGWLIGFDGTTADIMWFMPTDAPWHRLEQLQSGNLRLYNPAGSALEVDMLGNKIAGWITEGDAEFTAYFKRHNIVAKSIDLIHDLYYSPVDLPNNHRLALSVVDHNLITEFNDKGNIQQQWHLVDILALQSNRPASSATIRLAKALAYRQQTDSIILSLPRHQALASISRRSGQLQWLLGDPSGRKASWSRGLKPQPNTRGNMVWPSSPDRPHISAQGHIIVFDRPDNNRGRGHSNRDQTNRGQSNILVYAIDQAAMTLKQLGKYPVVAQLPARMDYANSAQGEQSLLLSYRLSTQDGLQADRKQFQISRLVRLSMDNIVKAPQHSPATPIMSLRLNSGLIYDNRLVTRLIPPKLSQQHDSKLLEVSEDKKGKGDTPTEISPPAQQSKTQIPDEIPITEGDWQIVLDSPQGTVKQTLKIDKQQGPIGLGHLDNYPVMVVINGDRLHFKARTTGTMGTATWRYTGTIDHNGFEAQGNLTVLSHKDELLASDIPWQAYRQ